MKRSDGRLLHPVIQQKLRNSAVKLFLSGKNPTDISKELGVSRQSVYNWIKKHSESGALGLGIHKQRPSKRYSAAILAECSNCQYYQKLLPR